MANSFFQFKQFTIHQDQCAMKVSTEACILGAWIDTQKPNRILDIGTGTGLLALMLAQRFDCPIDAVEIDQATAAQAKRNIEGSPWSHRIHIIQQDISAYAAMSIEKYDLIVCNPPFFQASQRSEIFKENLAKHETAFFEKKKLAQVLQLLLTQDGVAYVLYPQGESIKFEKEIKKAGLQFHPALTILNQPGKEPFRVISQISRSEKAKVATVELSIREGKEYSAVLKELMLPYYLKS